MIAPPRLVPTAQELPRRPQAGACFRYLQVVRRGPAFSQMVF